MTKHAPGDLTEFTACGFAEDAHESGDHDEPIVFATLGERVTCVECRDVITYYKSRFSPSFTYR